MIGNNLCVQRAKTEEVQWQKKKKKKKRRGGAVCRFQQEERIGARKSEFSKANRAGNVLLKKWMEQKLKKYFIMFIFLCK